jgi:hypothetical protein
MALNEVKKRIRNVCSYLESGGSFADLLPSQNGCPCDRIPPQSILHIFNPHPVTKNGTLEPQRVWRQRKGGRPLERKRRNGKNFLFSETMLSKLRRKRAGKSLRSARFPLDVLNES